MKFSDIIKIENGDIMLFNKFSSKNFTIKLFGMESDWTPISHSILAIPLQLVMFGVFYAPFMILPKVLCSFLAATGAVIFFYWSREVAQEEKHREKEGDKRWYAGYITSKWSDGSKLDFLSPLLSSLMIFAAVSLLYYLLIA